MVSGPLVGDETSNKVYTRNQQNEYKNPNHVLHHSSQPQSLTQFREAVASDDSSSHNGLPAEPANGPRGYSKFGNMVRIRLNSWSKVDFREIKWMLMSELEQVRCLVKSLEAKEVELTGGYGQSQFSADDYVVGNVRTTTRVNSEVGSVGPRDLVENRNGIVEKEKRSSSKKFPPSGSNKKLKSNGRTRDEDEIGLWFGSDKNPSRLFKSCSTLLAKLMKHKHGWVFNKPVDVKGLGLLDYYTIVKQPMDLGTVKTQMDKNWYKTPAEFAEDVRLTFHNAMLYNPKEQDVYVMAAQLLKIFEEKWTAIEAEYNLKRRNELGDNSELPAPVSRKVKALAPAPAPPLEMRTLDRAESMTKPVDPKLKPVSSGHPGRMSVPKKPKAKDPDKRDMTFEEKQRLSTNLQSLPSEKLDYIVQIIRKRTPALSQQEDEIEVDIASVDPETLWELDRFVTNYKKSLSKNKRKAKLDSQSIAEPGHDDIQETNVAPSTAEAPKEAKAVENIYNASSPVRREERGDDVSGSSSSSSESGSSSSDSDNDSSSGCGSDSNHSPRT